MPDRSPRIQPMDDITLILRLLWIPKGWSRAEAFEVAATRAPAGPIAESTVWKLWQRYTREPDIPPGEFHIITDVDELTPLPPSTEFLIMVSFTGGGAREGAEQFFDWRPLRQEEAATVCHEAWDGELEAMAKAARQLVKLPATQTPH
jgi:hypothetical protein